MIRRLAVSNVRLFDGQLWEFLLRPLTVFCGTNSSGKSTILRTLLLLRQSHGIGEPGTTSDGRLRLVGSQVDLGNYANFVSHNNSDLDVGIGIAVDGTLSAGALRDLYLQSTGKQPAKRLKGLDDGDMATCENGCMLWFGVGAEGEHESDGASEPVKPRTATEPDLTLRQAYLKSGGYQISHGGTALLTWLANATREQVRTGVCTLRMPVSYFDRIGGYELLEVVRPDQGDLQDMLCVLSGLFPCNIFARSKQWESEDGIRSEEGGGEPKWGFIPLPPALDRSLEAIQNALRSIHYLSPLRSPSKRYYMAPAEAAPGLDPAGDFLPYMLSHMDECLVTNHTPLPGGTTTESTLMAALNEWLAYLRTGEYRPNTHGEIKASSHLHVLVEVALKTVNGAEMHSLADSGFGYSQVLPILVRTLMANPGETVIVEQPELHLNPALQVRLAEFFTCMARAGKQLLIETHSEHIVNAIRVMVAEDETAGTDDMCAVYYFDCHHGGLKVHELHVQPDGSVPEWPTHFFGEAVDLTGRLLRAQKHCRDTKRGR